MGTIGACSMSDYLNDDNELPACDGLDMLT